MAQASVWGLGSCYLPDDHPAMPLLTSPSMMPSPSHIPEAPSIHPHLSFSLSVLPPLSISLQLHRPSVLHGSRPQQVRGSPLPSPPFLSSPVGSHSCSAGLCPPLLTSTVYLISSSLLPLPHHPFPGGPRPPLLPPPLRPPCLPLQGCQHWLSALPCGSRCSPEA